jgi:hemerythrin superfamily protein
MPSALRRNEADMEMTIPEIATIALSNSGPSTLGELLSAGKKLPPEATTVLMQDHAEVKAMFAQCNLEKDQTTKAALAGRVCLALTVHAKIEEEIFYPEAGKALEDDDLIAEAVEEHNEMKEQIAEIVEAGAAKKSAARPIKTLMQIVEHHVKAEEAEMFPDMRQTRIDLYELGARLAAARVEALLTLRRQAAQAEGRL